MYLLRRLNRWVDEELAQIGMVRRDLRINFRFRGRRWYIETFNPLWWLLMTIGTVAACGVAYLSVVAIIILGG